MKKKKVVAPREGKVGCIYARKSDAQSGEVRGRSTDQQMQACLLAAKAEGFDIPSHLIFIEEDGNKGEWFWKDDEGRNPAPHRPKLTEMITAIREEEVDAVFVWRTDRYYRGIAVAVGLLDVMKDHGVRLFVKNRDLAIHTASGYEAAMTEACSNQAYRDKISEDVTRDHAMLASVGELTHDPTMVGFRSKGKGSRAVRYVPEEVHIIRQIYRWYIYGDPGEAPLSASAIAARCMELGYRLRVGAKNQRVKYPDLVGVGDILRILSNNHYQGMMPHDGKIYATKHFDVPSGDGTTMGPVISPEEFEIAQQLRLNAKGEKRDRRAGLLNGVVVCGSCGRPMVTRRKKNGRDFVFCAYRQGRKALRRCHGSCSRSIILEVLEEWVLTHLSPILCAEILAIRATQDGDAGRRALASAEADLQRASDEEGKKLAELVGVLDSVQLAQVAAQLRSKREALQKMVSDLRTKVKEQTHSDDPYDLLSCNKSIVRQALMRAVKWIAVTPQGIVVLTASKAFLGARLSDAVDGKRGYRGATILPPTCQATLECRNWITDPESFLVGASMSRGRQGRVGAAELLPEFNPAIFAGLSDQERIVLDEVNAREDAEATESHAVRLRGYHVLGANLDAQEIECVRRAEELRALGNSLGKIAKLLDHEGYKSYRGKTIVATTVFRMLKRLSRYGSAGATTGEFSSTEANQLREVAA